MKAIIVMLLFLVTACPLAGQWLQGGISLNNTADSNSYLYPFLVADGHGGAYAGWEDYTQQPAHVYIQRVSHDGRFLWGPNGVQLSMPDTLYGSDQLGVLIVRPDEKFVYAVWYSPPFVRAQKLDTAGRRYWQPEGIIVNPLRRGNFVDIALDSTGGLFVFSADMDSIDPVTRKVIYTPWVQRIDSSGGLLWGDSCVVVSRTVIGPHYGGWIMGASVPGQAYVAWIDFLGHGSYRGDNQIFVQRFDENGRALWQENGRPVTEDLKKSPRNLCIIEDNRGGLIVFWATGMIEVQEVQHLDSNGTRLEGPDGRRLFDGYSTADILNDGHGGFFIYFRLGRQGYYYTEVQHYELDLSTKRWRNQKNPDHPGVEAVDYFLGERRLGPDYQATSITKDGAGGIFVVGPGYGFKENWVQWIDSTGRARWMGGGPYSFPTDSEYLLGKTICRDPSGKREHTIVRASMPGEAFIAWTDTRLGPTHTYIAKVTTKDGVVSVQPLAVPHDASFALRYAYPQPASGDAHVAGDVTRAGMLTVSVYDLTGREVARVFDGWRDPGSFELPVRLEGVTAGLYYIRARMGVQESVIPIVVTGRR